MQGFLWIMALEWLFQDMTDVRALKRHLQTCCGVTRFRPHGRDSGLRVQNSGFILHVWVFPTGGVRAWGC